MSKIGATAATVAYVAGLVGLGALAEDLSSSTGNDSSFWWAFLGMAAVWSFAYGFAIGRYVALAVPATAAAILMTTMVVGIDWNGLDTPPGAVFLLFSTIIGLGCSGFAFAIGLGVLARRAGADAATAEHVGC